MDDRVNEGSASWVTVRFKDKNRALYVPNEIVYRIDCETNNRSIKGRTAFTPVASEIEIMVAADENPILNSKNKKERRVMTVLADPDTPVQQTITASWYVINLQGV